MRKIERDMVRAVESFINNGKLGAVHLGNTFVSSDEKVVRVYLFGNAIFWYDKGYNEASFNMRGWNTPTTRSRLNALFTIVIDNKGKGNHIRSKNFEPYLNGVRISSSETYIVNL